MHKNIFFFRGLLERKFRLVVRGVPGGIGNLNHDLKEDHLSHYNTPHMLIYTNPHKHTRLYILRSLIAPEVLLPAADFLRAIYIYIYIYIGICIFFFGEA